jgi:hypothetical protein
MKEIKKEYLIHKGRKKGLHQKIMEDFWKESKPKKELNRDH